MKLGFVGTGVITKAVVAGFAQAFGKEQKILISPRSAETAEALARDYAHVTVAADNQAVIDGSDIVFLAIRPQIAEAVVRALSFRPRQKVVSFVAAVSIETLQSWISEPVTIIRTIPLPFVADLKGATAIFPPDAEVAALFAPLGAAVEVKTTREFDLLAVASAMMATYFGVLENSTRWLAREGLGYEPASTYMKYLFSGLSDAMMTSPRATFEEMKEDHSTKGGLNEQVFLDFAAHGGTKALDLALDRVMRRIEGKS